MGGSERTAIVTGAARRVGWDIARALLADGWRVVAHVHHEDDAVPDGATRAVADLSQRDCAARVFTALDGHPPLGLLVNNAARFAWDGFGEFSCDEFDAHMAVNVRAPALLIEAFAAHRARAEDASIVNILDSKLAAPNSDFLSYTLSKQALGGLTDLAARALAPLGLRVNAIAPALMLRSPGQSEENYRAMYTSNPLARGVATNDLVDALRYLVSAQCVTGQTIVVDSGSRFMNLSRDVQFLETQ